MPEDAGKRFEQELEKHGLMHDAIKENMDASLNLAMEIVKRDHATWTDAERAFVETQAKFGLALLVTHQL